MMALLLHLIALIVASSDLAAEIPSPTGYYEGTLTYDVEYMKDVAYASMSLGATSDFWFVVDREGKITGQGDVDYTFDFGIDWGMSAKVGVSMLKIFGASLDPQVTLTLDPGTAHHRYYLSGQVTGLRDPAAPKTLALDFSWVNPQTPEAAAPKLVLQLVGSVTVSGSISGSQSISAPTTGASDPEGGDDDAIGEVSGEVGAQGDVGRVIKQIDWTPVSPFGQDSSTVTMEMRSPYGPYVARFDYDGAGGNAATGVVVHWLAIQKMDFAAIEELARLRAELASMAVGTQGSRGAPGSPGSAGSRGDPGAPSTGGTAGTPGAGAGASETTETDAGNGSATAFTGRAGSVEVPVEGRVAVVFAQPFADDHYAVSLTPRSPMPQGAALAYTDKTATGFTVLVQGTAAMAPPATVTVDWIAAPFASP